MLDRRNDKVFMLTVKLFSHKSILPDYVGDPGLLDVSSTPAAIGELASSMAANPSIEPWPAVRARCGASVRNRESRQGSPVTVQ